MVNIRGKRPLHLSNQINLNAECHCERVTRFSEKHKDVCCQNKTAESEQLLIVFDGGSHLSEIINLRTEITLVTERVNEL